MIPVFPVLLAVLIIVFIWRAMSVKARESVIDAAAVTGVGAFVVADVVALVQAFQ